LSIYPNPANGSGPIQVQVSLNSPGEVKIQLFTIAFRKIAEKQMGQLPQGTTTLSLALADNWGNLLANGLYYLVLNTPAGRTVGKLLILR